MRYCALLFSVIFLHFTVSAWPDIPKIVVDSDSDGACINCSGAYMLEDSVGLTAEFILKYNVLEEFTPSQLTWPHNANPEYAYWYLFRFELVDTLNENWFIQFVDPHIGEIDVWLLENGDAVHLLESGFGRDFESRETHHKNHVVPISFRNGNEAYVLTRSKAPVTSSFRGHINRGADFIGYAVQEYYYLGMFYGILAILIVYSLSIYFFNRDNLYLYYVLYVIGCAAMAFNEDGMGFHMLWKDFPWVNHFLTDWAPFIFSTSFVAFGIKLLDLKKNMPAGRNVVIGAYIVSIVYFQVTAAPSIVSPFFLLPFLSVFVCAIYLARKANRSAKFFVVGYLFILISQAIYVLRIEGLMIEVPQPWEILVVYSFNVASILEVFILSLAMADRLKEQNEQKQLAQTRVIDSLRANEKLKDRVNRELEEKVAIRTEALQQQTEDLQGQAAEITRMNDILKGRNIKLQEERVMLKTMSFTDFKEAFPDDQTCIDYLVGLKWSDGFTCSKCGNDCYSKGRAEGARRCSKCSQEESPTANTLLHGIHFSVQKAFYLTYLILRNPGVSVSEVAKNGDLSRPSASKFKKRILAAQKRHARSKSSGWDGLLMSKPKS